VGISRDYPLKTRTSKQPTGEISGYKLIPFHPLKYPRSKQGLSKPQTGLICQRDSNQERKCRWNSLSDFTWR
jgi:hypothetical protein